ncbi:DUF6266 family protein [uncultured Marixanthomonas sp.]|uniref:DUF6266 family protein n=1 Tax=uncultured Marixanthomonas sp. TaxID=757245 RepID=UPI0030DC7971|tara:strand:- start:1225 stop:1866 length:642 start_codon:yes stop_codon:yes gene_type:complete
MAKFEKGILGGFSGKVGTVVGARWRGKNIMRSLPQRGDYTPSELQLQQRAKFKTVIQFLTPIQRIVGRFFGSEQGDKSPFNLATSYHLTEAVTPDGDGYVMDYPKVLISRGDLRGLTDESITTDANQELILSWTDNSGQGNADAADKLIVVVYAPTLKLYQQFDPAGLRSNASTSINLPAYYSGVEVQVWATFVTADENLAAPSSYLGAVTVS